MISALNKLFKKGIAILLNLSLIISLFSLYTFSATAEEEYDRPWLWPVPGSFQINSVDTYTDGSIHNQGQALDIGSNGYRGSQRLDVVSSTDGTVHYIQKSYNESTNKGSGWGNYVVIKTADFYIVYAHLQTVSCKYGEIKAGDVIGKMGTTGNSTGVHLHVQAYPVGESSNSTSIHIFDKFINNPLYAPKFRFWAGLHSHSVRYGEIIQKYYKNIDETYYTYSGGREDLSFEPKSLGAKITAIRVAGTRVYSQPTTSSNVVRTVDNGFEMLVYGYYIDSYGKIWYKLSENNESEWACETEVSFRDYYYRTDYENVSAPDSAYGSYSDIYFDGNLTSINKIKSVKARIVRDENVISECEIIVNAPDFEINNAFFDKLKVENMANGSYTYEIVVTETASFPGADAKDRSYTVFTSAFTINSLLTDTVPPLIEGIKLEELSTSTVKLSAVATDNIKVSSVTFNIKKNDGSFEKTFDADFDNSKYIVTANVSELNGSGDYTVTAKVTDSYGNTDVATLTLTIPSVPTSELWIVTDASPSLRIRSGPGTLYSKLGSLYNGDKLYVTEIVSADGYLWGKFQSGWTALTYCTYDSGYLYSLTFNLCGGSTEMSTIVNKKHGTAVTIPNVTPTRAGYKFLGWSTSPNSTTATYQPGASYTANASAQLYAVWSDNVKPTLNSVTTSSTEWTRDGVSVVVNASDDSGVVFYTFDGGESWRRSNSTYVYENTLFEIGAIGVKDSAGNVVYYNVKHEVKNIDNVPPVMPNEKPTVTSNGSKITLTFANATDSISGIDKYSLTYSTSPDLLGSVTVNVTSGAVLELENGVYYAKLVAYDKAGNVSSVTLDRFLVGEAQQLNTPSSFEIKDSSSTETVFAWDSVDNADGYVVYISANEDMSEAASYPSSENTVTVTNLQAGITYYATVSAVCSDGVYSESDRTEPISFVTVSNDSTVHAMKGYSDAVISGQNITVTLHNTANSFNMEVVVHERATTEYFNDSGLTDKITVTNESFSLTKRTVYVKVTAEDGTSTVYELTATRATYSPQNPTVIFNPENADIFVRDTTSFTITSTVSDGGVISTVWYAKPSNALPYVVGEGSVLNFTPTTADTYNIYAVVTNTNNKCYETTTSVTSTSAVVVVSRRNSVVNVKVSSKTYDANAISPEYADYVGDGTVTFKYYTDANCTNEVQSPVNAGKYYVKAFAEQTDEYNASVSEAVEFEIFKAEFTAPPVLSTVMPVLRDRHGYITVLCTGVEYSVNGGAWLSVNKDETLTFNENDEVTFRVAETSNYLASEDVSVVITPFNGTDSFIPNGNIEMTEANGYLIIASHKLTADVVINGLTKTENVYITTEDGNEVIGYVYTSCIIMIKDEIGVYKALTVVILGDVDLDGEVTSEDKTLILEFSNGVEAPDSAVVTVAADMDMDGDITSIDSYKAHLMTK